MSPRMLPSRLSAGKHVAVWHACAQAAGRGDLQGLLQACSASFSAWFMAHVTPLLANHPAAPSTLRRHLPHFGADQVPLVAASITSDGRHLISQRYEMIYITLLKTHLVIHLTLVQTLQATPLRRRSSTCWSTRPRWRARRRPGRSLPSTWPGARCTARPRCARCWRACRWRATTASR